MFPSCGAHDLTHTHQTDSVTENPERYPVVGTTALPGLREAEKSKVSQLFVAYRALSSRRMEMNVLLRGSGNQHSAAAATDAEGQKGVEVAGVASECMF
jgi:hypothetical protein